MRYEDGLTPEQREQLMSLILHHPGLNHIKAMIHEITETMREQVLTCPMPTDPQAAAIAVYAARMKAEGSLHLENALTSRLWDFKNKMMRFEEENKK